MKPTKTQMFVFIIACATIGIRVPIVALFLISVPIVALASRRRQNTYQNLFLQNFHIPTKCGS